MHIFLSFYTGCATWRVGSLFPDRGLNSSPRLSERRILATRPPGKSQTPPSKDSQRAAAPSPHRSTHHTPESAVEREDVVAGGSTTREGSTLLGHEPHFPSPRSQGNPQTRTPQSRISRPCGSARRQACRSRLDPGGPESRAQVCRGEEGRGQSLVPTDGQRWRGPGSGCQVSSSR